MDNREFKTQFLEFRGELKSYLLRIAGSREDAEDLTQDVFVRASKKLDTYKGESSLKTWVFRIATNLAMDHFRARQRWAVNAQDNASNHAKEHPELIDRMLQVKESGKLTDYEISEHIDFCFTCMSKTLPIEQQVAVILKDVYGFKLREIMQIMGLSEGKAKHCLADGRKVLVRIFDNKCALVHKKGVCHQCSELNGILNPKQNAQQELRKIQMIREADGKTSKELLKLRTMLVKNIDPVSGAGADLHSYFLDLMPGYSGLEQKTHQA